MKARRWRGKSKRKDLPDRSDFITLVPMKLVVVSLIFDLNKKQYQLFIFIMAI